MAERSFLDTSILVHRIDRAEPDKREVARHLSELPVVGADAAFLREAIRISRESMLSIWDALIVQAAVTAGCGRILTEDLQDGARIGGVRVENPFSQGAAA